MRIHLRIDYSYGGLTADVAFVTFCWRMVESQNDIMKILKSKNVWIE